MTPAEFIAKWRPVALKERSAAQTHFVDLCRLLGLDDPVAADPKGDWFTFEKGATKAAGGEGWADVWRKGCFGWEYKGRHKDLDAAHRQLLMYAAALENPPLLVTCDTDRIVIRTNFTNTVQGTHTILLDDLLDGAKRDLLRAAFTDPERFRPKQTRDALTAEAAARFSDLAQRLRARGHDPQAVAHFVNRLVFCMFAEDVGLLPEKLFQKMLGASRADPASFAPNAAQLFAAMRNGGHVGFTRVDWFNGGLFDDDAALPLERADIADLIEAARLDWSQIDPSILGTLFERGLDPAKRSQLGAHYTDRDKIMKIVNPVVVEPLLAEWAEAKSAIEADLAREKAARSASAATRAHNDALARLSGFLERLRGFRILDPACGSGNFLYVALRALKDIEHRVNVEAEALGLPRAFPAVGPEAVLGIELNPYAAELARVSVWIGEIQWMRQNGYEAGRNPILRPLDTIECRDAILNEDGTRADWPDADVVIGNPPFLGDKLMRDRLGDAYTGALRRGYKNVLPGNVNFVTYWFEQNRRCMKDANVVRSGLVATNAIRQQQNRIVLEAYAGIASIFNAWADEEWVLDGADVGVSLICLSKTPCESNMLDGIVVPGITSKLVASRDLYDLTKSVRLRQNVGNSFFGFSLAGAFDVDGSIAREWLTLPNPNGRPNSDVLKPAIFGKDLTTRPRDRWIIDFYEVGSEAAATLYEAPFEYILQNVRPIRENNNRKSRREHWWLFGEARPNLRRRLEGQSRYICTPERSKHRFFWMSDARIAPEHRLVVFPTSSAAFFGLLSSWFHVKWAIDLGSRLVDRPGYNTRVCFDTFPFPEGLTPDLPANAYETDPRAQAIAEAAAELERLRQAWLNPPDLVVRVPEVVPGYPDRLLPKDDEAAAVLKKRTLTNLYNQRPAWLDQAHRRLDEAVAEAYGWGDDWRAGVLTDDEILARLFALNQARGGA